MTQIWIHDMVDISDLTEVLVYGDAYDMYTQGDSLLNATVYASGVNHQTIEITLPDPTNWTTAYRKEINVRLKNKMALSNTVYNHIGLWAKDNSSHKTLCLGWNDSLQGSDGEETRDYYNKFSFHTNINAVPSPKTVDAGTIITQTDWEDSDWTINEYVWLKLIIHANNDVEAWADFTNSETSPTNFSNALGISSGITMGNIIKIGVSCFTSNVGLGTIIWEIDKLSIKSNVQVVPTGLDASVVFDSYYLKNASNVLGAGKLDSPSPFLSDVSATTFIAQLKKELIYTNVYGNVSWQGEVASVSINNHLVVLEAEEMSMKTKYTMVGASPVQYEFDIVQVDELVFIDERIQFDTVEGVIAGYLCSYVMSDLYSQTMRPDSSLTSFRDRLDSWNTIAGLTEAGSSAYVYLPYDDTKGEDENGHLMYKHTPGFGIGVAAFVEYSYHIYTKSGNTWESLTIDLEFSYLTSTAYMDIYIWNSRTGAFEVIRLNEPPGGRSGYSSFSSSSLSFTKPKTISLDLNDELTNAGSYSAYNAGTEYNNNDRATYQNLLWTSKSTQTGNTPAVGSAYWQLSIFDVSAEIYAAGGAGEFSKYKIRIAYEIPNVGDLSDYLGIWMNSITVTHHNENLSEYGYSTIDSVADGTFTVSQTNSLSLPEADGFGVGDRVIITKSIEDYLQDQYDGSTLAANLGALTIDVTDGTTTAITKDYTYKSFFDLLQHMGDLLNATWWIAYTTPITLIIRSADNLVSSGVILTRNDMIDFNLGNWSYDVDATNERSTVTVVGKSSNAITSNTSTPDHTADGGPEEEVFFDNTLTTITQVTTKAASIKKRKTGASKYFRCIVNQSSISNSYENLEVGKTVVTNVLTHDGSTIIIDTFVVIHKEMNRNEDTGDNEHVTLLLQKRET